MAFRPADFARLARFNSSVSSDMLELYESSLDAVIEEEISKKPHRTFAPSSMRCERLSWFRLRGTEPDTPKSVDRVMEFTARVGDACHLLIQQTLSTALGDDWIDVSEHLKSKNFGFEYTVTKGGYETQVEILDPPVRFACDGLIKWKDKLYLVEIKSSELSSFQDLIGPKPRHIDQVKGYCTLLDVRDVLFIYIDRQYGSIKCYELNIKDYEVQETWDMFKRVKHLADVGIAPDGLPKGDQYCGPSWCPYFEKCKSYGRY